MVHHFITMDTYGMDLGPLLAAGETLDVEFKRRLGKDDLYQAVVCMANGTGGLILVGVDDDGTVVGATGDHGGTVDADLLAGRIQNGIEPPLSVDVEVVPWEGKDVAVITVPQAKSSFVGTRKGLFVKRLVGPDGRPACMPMTPMDVLRAGFDGIGLDYARAEARGAEWAHLDPGEFDRFRRLAAQSAGDKGLAELADAELLRALDLLTPDGGISLGAILVFGTSEALRRWAPTAEVLFQDSRPHGLEANEDLLLPLLSAFEEIEARLALRNSVTPVEVGLVRVDVPLLSESVRRESIANALVHRDYAEVGPIQVTLTGSTFSVASPGGFPRDVSPANILNRSAPRSPALANVFKRAGLVERRGKGVQDMFASQLRAGRGAPDYGRSTQRSVIVDVPLGDEDRELLIFLARRQNEGQRALTLTELRMVHGIKHGGPASSADVAEWLRLPVADVRGAATALVEAGVLEARGNGRAQRYMLTARFYELAEDRAAYLRLRPVDRIQQRRLIADYVREFGSITRSKAAELCQIAPTAARAVLKSMTEEGLLELRGERRAAHYVLPGS